MKFRPFHFGLVTSAEHASLPPDEQILCKALRERGHSAEPAVWDDDTISWNIFDACVVRSTWDFHLRPILFASWVSKVSQATLLVNSAKLISWNIHKTYLLDLELQGVPIVPTVVLPAGEPSTLDQLIRSRSWEEVIIKPAISASSYRTKRFSGRDPAMLHHLNQIHDDCDALLQPFIPSVLSSRERSYIIVDGAITHVISRAPFNTGSTKAAPQPKVAGLEDETELVQRTLSALPEVPVYGRIDLVRLENGKPVVAEVETIEPTLFFREHPPSAGILADAIANKTRSTLR